MDINELKLAWQALEQRLDQQQQLLHRVATDRVRSRLRTQGATAAGVALGGVLLIRLASAVLPDSGSPLHLQIAAIAVLLMGAGMLVAALLMLWLLRIDYDRPIAEVQQGIARLRRLCIRAGWWVGVPFWVMWVPLVLVACQARGFDLFAARPQVVWTWLLCGVLGMLATYGLGWWSRQPGHGRLRRWLDRIFAGPYVEQARESLEEIERFRHE
ncbi:MAG TPA: hypothetical protein VD865_05410 [Stenotrophomonas sp.]|nr:hypothetical protein [Stenotrophomonas sp.]